MPAPWWWCPTIAICSPPPWTPTGLYRDGSYGLGLDGAAGRNHRIAAALTFQSPWAFAGAEYVRALGFNARPDLVSDTLGAWASAYLFRNYLGVMTSYAHIRQDVATAGTQVNIVTAGLFGDAFGYLLRNRRRVRLNPGVILNDNAAAHLENLKPMPAAEDIVDRCIECGFCEPLCPSRSRRRLSPDRYQRRARHP